MRNEAGGLLQIWEGRLRLVHIYFQSTSCICCFRKFFRICKIAQSSAIVLFKDSRIGGIEVCDRVIRLHSDGYLEEFVELLASRFVCLCKHIELFQ
jgi:hypothetical protein